MKEILAFCGAICATGILLTSLNLRENKADREERTAEKLAEREERKAVREAEMAERNNIRAEKAVIRADESLRAASIAATEAANLTAEAEAAGFSVAEYTALKELYEASIKKGDLKMAKEIGEKLFPFAFQ